MYDAFGRRVFDVLVSSLALLVLSPIMISVSLLIMIKLGRPVIFRQVRGGYRSKPFDVLKFRTMKNCVGPTGELLSDDDRLTHFGRWLRATSLDELPGLWNVIRGDMSLVGPRPLIYDYVELYSTQQKRRHEVRPGITGWAQVNGRNSIGWEEKFALDVWYVDNRCFRLDLKILLLTVNRILRRDGITAQGSATAERFMG